MHIIHFSPHPTQSLTTPLMRRALAIGSFDGVHRGHQAIIKYLRQWATIQNQQGLPCRVSVMILEPQPREFFAKRAAISHPENHPQHPTRISPLREKLQRLKSAGVDEVVIVPFNHRTAHITAQDFVHHFLHQKLAVNLVVTGADFRFGAKRMGDTHLLRHMGQALDFEFFEMPTVNATASDMANMHGLPHGSKTPATLRFSSSLIRQCLMHGDFLGAQQILGYPFSISGKVVRGEALARQWHVPTANIHFKNPPPLSGIFTAMSSFESEDMAAIDETGEMATKPPRAQATIDEYPSIINLGRRPSTEVQGRIKLESHLLTWRGETFYGRRLRVRFIEKLRDEKHFSNSHELRAQIEADVKLAREKFGL